MRIISDVLRSRSPLLQENSVHIMCLSFEERCLAYPSELSRLNLSAQKHTLYCIRLSDENVSGFLQEKRREHENKMRSISSSIHFGSLDEILQVIQDLSTPINIYIDMSTLPRQYIFQILKAIFEKYDGDSSAKIFCIYTYPKNYLESSLQEPAEDIKYIFTSPSSFKGKNISAIILPGFDIEYTIVGLTHIRAISVGKPNIFWFIPFPGRTYRFYERVIESHLHLLMESRESNIILYPQEELKLSFNILLKQIDSLEDPILIMPMGCRIICISTFLSVWYARKNNRQVDILFPRTSRYDSLRSEGYSIPLIEELPIDVAKWRY